MTRIKCIHDMQGNDVLYIYSFGMLHVHMSFIITVQEHAIHLQHE